MGSAPGLPRPRQTPHSRSPPPRPPKPTPEPTRQPQPAGVFRPSGIHWPDVSQSAPTHPPHPSQAPAAAPLPFERQQGGPCPGAVIVRIEQPGKPVIVLDHDLLRRLEATFRALPRDATGMVLASASERAFIAGADLKTISEWSDDQLHRYLEFGARIFGMVADLPFPTVAAINGAALGGGLELAMHCDGLVAAPPPPRDGQPGRPYPVGLPEAGLSLCPGWGGTNLLPARMDPSEAIRRAAAGKPLMFDEARDAGLFAEVAPSQDQLISTALEWLSRHRIGRGLVTAQGRDTGSAGRITNREPPFPRDGRPTRWIGRPAIAARAHQALRTVRDELPQTESAAAVIAAIEAGLSEGWEAALQSERNALVRLRHTPAAQQALTAFFAKSRS
jgi:enoyl-CoA hydratase/carnithine racemase